MLKTTREVYSKWDGRRELAGRGGGWEAVGRVFLSEGIVCAKSCQLKRAWQALL